jgi:hypothetical protein
VPGTAAPPAEPTPGPAPPAPRAEPRFVPLFNGRDLAGWAQLGDETASWKVINGTLVGHVPPDFADRGDSVLKTDRSDYRNFHLRLRAMRSEGGECSVRLVPLPGPNYARTRYRVSLGTPASDPSPYRELGRLTIGANDGAAPLLKRVAIPERRWFTMDVVVSGRRVTVDVDGTRTADHTDGPGQPEATDVRLYVGLNARTARFQSVEIKELP